MGFTIPDNGEIANSNLSKARRVPKVLWLCTFVIMLTVATTPVFGQDPVSPLIKINIGHSMISPNAMAVWVAKDQGFFRKYGLDADLTFLAGDTPISQSMVAGAIQIATMGGGSTIASVAHGGDLVFVSGLVNYLNFKLWARLGSPINRVQDLNGKAIGISAIGSLVHTVGLLMIEEHGMTAKDVTFRALGDAFGNLAGLERGVVDAVVFGPFAAKVTKQLKLIYDAVNLTRRFPGTSVISTRRFVQSSPEVVENSIKALAEAVAFIDNSVNKEAVKSTLRLRMKTKSSEEEELLYAETLRTFDGALALEAKDLEGFIRFLGQKDPAILKLRVEDIAEFRFVTKLNQSGFIESLYGKRR